MQIQEQQQKQIREVKRVKSTSEDMVVGMKETEMNVFKVGRW